jgi:signal transduction histidine kinase/ActR/RegA family two-component response regulator
VLSALPVAVTHCGADLRYVWVSERYAEWLRIPGADIVGRPIVEVLGQRGMDSIRHDIDAVLGGRTVNRERPVHFKTIGDRWIQAEYSPTYGASGAVDGWVSSVVDVTDRRRAESRLTAAHDALARLFDLSVMPASSDALPELLEAVVDTAIDVTAADMGSVQLYDDTTGCLRIAAQRGFERSFLEHFAVVRGGDAACGAAMQRRQQVIVEDVSSSPLFDDRSRAVMTAARVKSVQLTLMTSRQGRILGVISTHWRVANRPDVERLRVLEIVSRQAADALEHRRQEERLREADRRKDEFLAMLGHELRNPLAPIITATELMAMRDDAVMVEERKSIERQARHMIRLVDDLLDVSRITRGKVDLCKEPVALAQIVDKAVEIASQILEQRSHRLSIEVPSNLRSDVDAGRMVQVLANLLTNAAKYTDPGGQVRVTAEGTKATVTIRVADTGVGIAPSMLPVVFEPFVQEKQALNRPRGGLGLGLAIAKSLVELHGGSVSAHSDGIGRGSEFTITLPRSHRRDAHRAAPSKVLTAKATPGARILLVDDNEGWAEAAAHALTLLGHEVRVAHDGPEALRAVDDFTPTLALLDIGLPVMDGYELARRLRDVPSLSGMRLVAVTGYGESAAVRRSAKAGFEAHLVKPVEVEMLDKVARDRTRTYGRAEAPEALTTFTGGATKGASTL